MSKVIKLKKGLDIKLQGGANRKLTRLPLVHAYAVKPGDFRGVTPKLLVSVDDPVKIGTPLFFDKYRPELLFVSPVSGKVSAVNRGEKRRILEIVITPEATQQHESFEMVDPASASREALVELLLKAGLWPMIIQRPYGRIADPKQQPKAIFVSGFDSSPLAPDTDFLLQGEDANLQAGFDVLKKLTGGKVHLGLRIGKNAPAGIFDRIDGVEKNYFEGPHPAGNVGVQIHHVSPINKGETIWTVDIQHVAMIGRFFRSGGKLDLSKVIALTGSEVMETQYFQVITGVPVNSVVRQVNICPQPEGRTVRIIDGNVLTGTKVAADNYLGFYGRQVTVIPEGDHYELFGWGMPRFDKFSVSRSYFSWLTPNRRYNLDTNLNGGHRPFVVTGLYDRYLPMDIYPMYLLKAILAGDIDKMENLGMYEVIEEDFALCEFVDPSKTDMQDIIRQGIELMIKELN